LANNQEAFAAQTFNLARLPILCPIRHGDFGLHISSNKLRICVMSKRQQPDAFRALMQIAQEQQGYFTTKQALEAGYADNTHPYHVRAGNWLRIQRGIYRLADLSPAEDGFTPAYLLWTRGRNGKPVGVLSHETALSYFRLGDFNPPKIHITVPADFRRNSPTPKAVVLHRDRLAPAEITLLRGMRICRVARALCDVVRNSPVALEECQLVAKEARRRGLILEGEIKAVKKHPKFAALGDKLFL
jgi:predicted transcriptional regulator of viral defense system